MPALKRLGLSSDCDLEGVHAWKFLSKNPAFPYLEDLTLHWFVMHFQDFEDFILKHSKTLKALDLNHIELPDGYKADCGRVFAALGDARKLEHIDLLTCYFGRDSEKKVRMPTHVLSPWSMDEEDEDGFTWARTERSTIHYKGRD
jgi:hypothetical protein